MKGAGTKLPKPSLSQKQVGLTSNTQATNHKALAAVFHLPDYNPEDICIDRNHKRETTLYTFASVKAYLPSDEVLRFEQKWKIPISDLCYVHKNEYKDEYGKNPYDEAVDLCVSYNAPVPNVALFMLNQKNGKEKLQYGCIMNCLESGCGGYCLYKCGDLANMCTNLRKSLGASKVSHAHAHHTYPIGRPSHIENIQADSWKSLVCGCRVTRIDSLYEPVLKWKSRKSVRPVVKDKDSTYVVKPGVVKTKPKVKKPSKTLAKRKKLPTYVKPSAPRKKMKVETFPDPDSLPFPKNISIPRFQFSALKPLRTNAIGGPFALTRSIL